MILANALQRIVDGSGWYITLVGMAVVFIGLIVLVFIMNLVIKIFATFKERENRQQILRKISKLAIRRATIEIPYGPENTADVNDEVVAAITLALNLYFTMYETPDEIAKITKMMKVSPMTTWKLFHRAHSINRSSNRFSK